MKKFTVHYTYLNRGKWFVRGEKTVEAWSKEDAERIITKRFNSPLVESFYIDSVW